jgi:hypothetical protein
MGASGEYRLADPEAAASALAAELDVRAEPARTGNWIFYDTFDGLVRAAGLVVRHAAGRLAVLERESGAERAGALVDRAPARAFAHELPAPLRAELAGVIDVRALTPIARGRSREQRLAVLNEDAKTVVRLTVAAPAVRGAALEGRLRVAPVRGYDDDAARVRATLEDRLGLAAAT